MTPLLEPVPDVPVHVVVMGVSGCGKSTIARALHERLGWEFAEGDEYHPRANVEKMASGRPLMDEDRWPWLRTLADWTRERDERGESTVLSCSSLKRSYRDLLRDGGAGTYFVHMHGDKGILLERMESREHFMPPTLLESQLDTLELLEPDERGVLVDVALPVERAVRVVLAHLQ
ncbi:gluconate kinase [Ornithinimicrobium sp. CNJ-824]|uniref:gluconokinase n=1 Tax=Ornithinimicrobium sp. CNJ-824 TaxID=1904966 RepID=UPI0009686010|nr:gluconokinase [Ornithinimicrobium sp. CNJ-824]OLT23858.1 gluconate kinase [Ornithinimicrobium sp. CNJ-824]